MLTTTAYIRNDENQFILVKDLHGHYKNKYDLPSGRVLKNEQILDSIKRIVNEKTGLVFVPTSIISIENLSGTEKCWFGFLFIGTHTGTLNKNMKDYSAGFESDYTNLSLSSKDSIGLIEIAKKYYTSQGMWHKEVLPNEIYHEKLIIRIIFVTQSEEKQVSKQFIDILNMSFF